MLLAKYFLRLTKGNRV